ncbi:unnamed protein product [Gemmataceae bacterium]|nr:unnamed protein product [Gemmataceae bacterium]VTT98815.1 unnamed protein product [Gemmataceae bacterium]
MLDDREAFRLAILAKPHDPTGYLVFADWLDDHGEPREATFQRSLGTFLQNRRRLPGRVAHWLPAGQGFPDHIYADDDRFAIGRYHGGSSGSSLLVVDLNDITGGRGLARRHRGLENSPAVAVGDAEPLPVGVSWDRLRGDVCGGAEFVGTFGERVKAFADLTALIEAMRAVFNPDGTSSA